MWIFVGRELVAEPVFPRLKNGGYVVLAILGIWPFRDGFARSWRTTKQRPLLAAGLRVDRPLKEALPGHPLHVNPIGTDTSAEQPVRYAFRSLDRQWIIPDKRVLNRPNPTLWGIASDSQVYLTAPRVEAPTGVMAVSESAVPPDMDRYGGSGGRVYPLWADGWLPLRTSAPNCSRR